MLSRYAAVAIYFLAITPLVLSGCAMSEEIKRIDENKHSLSEKAASLSTDLNGEQLYFRSCNTCHPTGRQGPMGPSLEHVNEHFLTDAALRDFIRKGKGVMPAQTKDVMDDKEMDSLIAYVRHLND
ncbi:MAG: cytochrome c [Candidatus Obscuribacterales bacterium]|nr:cytochrome c [Candidatus Obscuribacterales bacterium]